MDAGRLTVLLLLKGRPEYTARWLAYAARARLPAEVLIADGSDDGAAEASRLAAERAGLPLRYERFPHDADLPRFYAKLERALELVRTPLVCLADNDDFLIPQGLRDCAAWLEARPDYSCCGGRMPSLTLEGAGKLYGRARFEPDASEFAREDGSALARARAHLRDYRPTWYDVHRTAGLLDSVRRLRAASPADVFIVELWESLLTAAQGKIVRLPRPLVFRQRDTTSSVAAAGSARATLRQRFAGAAWKADLARLTADVAAAAAALDGTPEPSALEALRRDGRAYEEAASGREAAGPGPARRALKSALLAVPGGREALELAKRAARGSDRPTWPAGPDAAEAEAVRAFLSSPEKS